MTGIKRNETLNKGISKLKNDGIIKVYGDSKRGYTYDINIRVQKKSKGTLTEPTSSITEPELVRLPNPQKKKENTQKKRVLSPSDILRNKLDEVERKIYKIQYEGENIIGVTIDDLWKERNKLLDDLNHKTAKGIIKDLAREMSA
jgi:hypothetical protein